MPEYFTEGSAMILKNEDTFFNPAQELNRDITAEVIKAYFKGKENIRVLTAMSATGLRGIRYLNEIENVQLFFNDICPNAVETIQNNLKFNNFNTFKFIEENDNLRGSKEKINITQSDCHLIMNKYHAFFDVIDIDPFGSCVEFVNSAFKGIKHNGLICFTCTDKAALCSNESKCYLKYNTIIKKVFCKNETPIRVLLSYISRELAKYDAKIIPIVSLSVDFYVRVIVRVFKGQGKSVLNDNVYSYICKHCLNRVETPMTKVLGCKCNICDVDMPLYGPFWKSKLYDYEIIDKILNNQIDDKLRLAGILRLMRQEIEDMFYFEMPLLASKFKMNCCKIRDVMNALANAGFRVSLTHCDNNSFKSNASIDIVKKIMEQIQLNSEHGFSLTPNSTVDKIFSAEYYKGKISSGLKPLSLPKK